jgi:hypothetical protein
MLEERADQEPVAHMMPSDLERFAESETFAQAFSVAVSNPEERSIPLYTHPAPQPQPVRRSLQQLCDALPEGVMWGDPLTPDVLSAAVDALSAAVPQPQREPTEAQIEAATDAWQAHCGLLLLSREGARDEVLIVLRAALAAKEQPK